MGVSSDVMAVNGSWLLDELAIEREHDQGRISMTGGHCSLAALWVFEAASTTAYDIAFIIRLSSRK